MSASKDYDEWITHDFEEGDRVRFSRWLPGRGRQENTGTVTNVTDDTDYLAFTQLKVEYEDGWSKIPINCVDEVLDTDE